MFGNKMENIIVPMKEEATGGWRKLHNEDLFNL
jgi:hypothetical protein